MFKNAIVRQPSKSMIHGLTSSSLGVPDYKLAVKQHQAYVEALTQCGLSVTVLPALEAFPDSVFVEDVALCTPQMAILTRPGAPSRQQETLYIKASLTSFYPHIEAIIEPGFLDAGDVMNVDSHYYIGLSKRTNDAGARQLIAILGVYGYTGSIVTMQDFLHLKTGVNYIGDRFLLATGEMCHKPEFEHFDIVTIPKQEAYAANSLRVNDYVLVPLGFPYTKAKIKSLGYKIIELDMSEFQKIDGGLSCLSLRF